MSVKLPADVDSLPTGVDINGNLLRIALMYENERRREPLRNVAKINKAASAYADNKRRTLLAEIKENRLGYAAHFPDSVWLKARQELPNEPAKRTVDEGLAQWLEVARVKKAIARSSTIKASRSMLEGSSPAEPSQASPKASLNCSMPHYSPMDSIRKP